MATKTFKIGEYCVGGVLSVEVTERKITIITKEWDFSAGSNKSSNQSNAKELHRIEVELKDYDAFDKLSDYLNVQTTSYYTDVVLKWVNSKISAQDKLIFW